VQDTLEIDTRHWPAGIYFYQLIGAQGIESLGKLIKI
jgi:hypothetical protein